MFDLNGKYVIFRPEIGKGSYSKVYKAKDKNHKSVAIKRINIEKINNKLLDRIELEINIHKKLQHDNIVKLNEIIRDEKNICLVLEYCEEEFNNLKYNLEIHKLQDYIKQLNNALLYLRNNNIIHRDLKPKNILISDDVVKLADFGFATDKTIDMHNTVCGSPLYMAPEIMKIFIAGTNNDPLSLKNSYDSKCDLWSLGLIIYECVYKEHPYRDSLNILDLNKNIFTNKILFYETNKNNVKIDLLLRDLLARMLVIDTSKRISWDDYFNHDWFNSDININLNISVPISIPIPITKKKSYENCIHSLPLIADYEKNIKNNYEDINDDYLENYRQNRPKHDINTIKDYFINHLYNKEISDDVMETIDIYNENPEHKMNKDKKNEDADYDYIIIDEKELLTFNEEPEFKDNISSNLYNALSNSYELIKKPFKYFSY
jgi:serine/threonine-protein kinase ULK/ATG1